MAHQVIEDLLADDAHHLKRLLGCHRVDQHVAVDADKVLGVEYAVLILAPSAPAPHDSARR